jgi:RHS repeat-associated protein
VYFSQYRFTGKERDAESGNDYFGARYYSSAMGRFMSPDPLLNSGHPKDPQSWNRYSYTRNNPMRRIDPTGMYDVTSGCLSSSGNNCQRLKDAVAKANQLLKGMDPKSNAAKELTKALKAVGTEGDHNGVTVSFGKTPTGAGSMETDGQHVTIDFNRLDAAQDNHQLGGEDIKADVDDAGHIAHEGIHLANNKVREGQADEPEAYDVQSHVNEAGHSTSTSGVWNESWANGPDREVLRQNAVKEAAQMSVDAEEKASPPKELKPQ